jgi:hypothetical protein
LKNHLRLPFTVVALTWLAANVVIHIASFASLTPLPRGTLIPLLGFSAVGMVIFAILATPKVQSPHPQSRQRASRAGGIFMILILYTIVVGWYSLSAEAKPWPHHVYARIITAFAVALTWLPITAFAVRAWPAKPARTE